VHRAGTAGLDGDADLVVVEEKLICANGNEHWLCGAVDPEADGTVHGSSGPATTTQTTR
jgi:hypothetical protein